MIELTNHTGSTGIKGEIEHTVRSAINVLLEGENGVGKDYLAGLIHRKRDWRGELVICDCESTNRDQVKIVEKLTSCSFFPKLVRSNNRDILLLRRIDLLQVHLLAQLSDFLEKLGKMGGVSRNTLLSLGIIGTIEKREDDELPDHMLLRQLLNNLFCYKIEIPPLRKRVETIPWFIDRFLSILNCELKRHVTELAPETLEIFLQYPWPNNLSELRAELERDITLTREDEKIRISALSDRLTKYAAKNGLFQKNRPKILTEPFVDRFLRA
ncbi:MAG TPA: sigma 54-interacting transcriptional regulator [candidate division Zixibacteria bacterium]